MARRIYDLMREDPVILAEDIQVRVRNGQVRLSGIVESAPWRERLEELVSRLPGVESVENEVAIGERPSQSDQQVTEDITRMLDGARLSQKTLTMSYRSGIVTLSGRVDTLKQKMDLEALLTSQKGVREISSNLRIGFENPPDDTILRNKVMLAITELGRVAVDDLKVRVNRGVVYLKGQAGFETEKLTLLEKIASVNGVREIMDEIASGEEESSASTLHRQIEAAFRADPRLAGRRISFTLAGGTLYLRGEIASLSQAEALDEALANFPAVKRVVNELTLRR